MRTISRRISRELAVAMENNDFSGIEDKDLLERLYGYPDFTVTNWHEESNDINGRCSITGKFDHCVDIEIKEQEYELLDTENYFDQAEAVYTYCILWHEGQWSTKYRVQCSIDFRPGTGWSESFVEEENYFYPIVSTWSDDELEKFSEELKHYLKHNEG